MVAEYVEGKGRDAAKSTMMLHFLKLKKVFDLEQPWSYHDYVTMLNDALNYAGRYAGESNEGMMGKWLQMPEFTLWFNVRRTHLTSRGFRLIVNQVLVRPRTNSPSVLVTKDALRVHGASRFMFESNKNTALQTAKSYCHEGDVKFGDKPPLCAINNGDVAGTTFPFYLSTRAMLRLVESKIKAAPTKQVTVVFQPLHFPREYSGTPLQPAGLGDYVENPSLVYTLISPLYVNSFSCIVPAGRRLFDMMNYDAEKTNMNPGTMTHKLQCLIARRWWMDAKEVSFLALVVNAFGDTCTWDRNYELARDGKELNTMWDEDLKAVDFVD